MSIFKSHLNNDTKTTALLKKIKELHSQKASRVVFEIAGDRFSAKEATNVALDETLADNNIVFTRPTGPTVKASKEIQDLTYTAVAAGADGNDIQIEYLDTGTAGAEAVTVVGSVISVSMEAGVSTAAQIKAAIEAEQDAADLVSVEVSGTAGDAQAAQAATNLAGGSDTESYDTADILLIKRLRTKKYLIRLRAGSDPAAS